jgi:hypothetical protein
MDYSKTRLTQVLLGCCASLLASATFALPALQLGPTDPTPGPGWTYIAGGPSPTDDTWVYTGGANTTANLSAFANSDTAGANGAYAWDAANSPLYAYLVVSTIPKLGSVGGPDYFDIGVANVPGVTYVTSGYGAPPLEDSNSIAPHGVFDTYFEIYQFNFDVLALGTITNTEPQPCNIGDPGYPNCPLASGAGYSEAFQISINTLNPLVTGLHFDLFTTTGSGDYTSWLGNVPNKSLVNSVAPFSHDAQWNPGPPIVVIPPDTAVPVPGTLLLAGLALVGLAWSRRAV